MQELSPRQPPFRAQRRLAADIAEYRRLMGADEEGTLARLKGLRRAGLPE